MRDRSLNSRYADFVAFPGFTLGLIVILIDGWLDYSVTFDRAPRAQLASESSFAQLSSPEREPIILPDTWMDCTVVLSKQQVDPPCE